MNIKTNYLAFLLTALSLCHGATSASAAEAYPSRAVKVIVPYGTGGGSDTLARQIAARLQALWGQGVTVDNKAGASGNIGTELVVKSPADGYTLLLQNSTMVVSSALSGGLNYNPEKDLTPIMLLGLTPITLVANQTTNIKSVKELMAYAKANPNTLNYGSCGVGTPQHFVMELVKEKTKLDAVHAGYKGCAPALTDVLGGQIPLAILSSNLVAPHIKTGRLNGIGVASKERYALHAAVPTFEEQGLKPLEISIWYALMGPANMPKEVVERIYNDVKRVLAERTVEENLSKAGVERLEGSASDLTKLIKSDLVKYTNLAKSANIKPE
jgi:tripartite-type tricarboxylate transporter receptor subunit TctC